MIAVSVLMIIIKKRSKIKTNEVTVNGKYKEKEKE